MKKIYIAGPYSSDNVLGALENIRKGMRIGTKLLLQGFAVFCPWADHSLFLQLREGERIDIETIRAASMEWLKVADAVLVLNGYTASRGTLAEIMQAMDLDKPIFFSLQELITWANRSEHAEAM